MWARFISALWISVSDTGNELGITLGQQTPPGKPYLDNSFYWTCGILENPGNQSDDSKTCNTKYKTPKCVTT